MSYGLTPAGFTLPTLEEIRGEWETELRGEIDATLDLSEDQPLGQVVAVAAHREVILWEVLQTLANMINPNASEGAHLDNTCALTGTTREPAKKSTVTVTCNVNAGFTKSAGAIMLNVDGNADAKFVNVSDVGPLSAGNHSIDFESVDYGPVVANAGTLTVITNAVSGLNSATNPLDAVRGSEQEKDADLRARREEEVAATGACTPPATRADSLQVAGVKQSYVFENVTFATDANGLPPKSFEVVIYDGDPPEAVDADVALAVWKSKPSGAETYGNTSVLVTDPDDGVQRSVKFSRATIKNVWLDFTVTVDPKEFPSNGADTIKAEVATYALGRLNLGVDVVGVAMKSAVMKVKGVLDVPTLKLGFSASPTGTANLLITGREIASVDTSRITVTTTEGEP